MQIKQGVRLLGLRPELIIGVIAADDIWKSSGRELILTSVVDGSHSNASLHYTGCAVDFRINNLAATEPPKFVQRLKEALPTDYDIVLEKDHIHLEWQPKEPY